MRDNVFWRKEASIITMLAKELGISPEEAVSVFYSTKAAKLFADPETGLQLMSDGYVLEDVLREILGRRVGKPR